MRLRHHSFDFGHRDHWKETTEQQKQREEQTETSQQHSQVRPCRRERCPTRWQVITTERRDDDHKTLEPHLDVDKDGHDENEPDVLTNILDPQKLRRDEVFERPNSAVDPLVKRFFENPEQQMLALAVWDGQAQNRGGRKHITNWIPMRVEK